jgi:hypothetical protein
MEEINGRLQNSEGESAVVLKDRRTPLTGR